MKMSQQELNAEVARQAEQVKGMCDNPNMPAQSAYTPRTRAWEEALWRKKEKLQTQMDEIDAALEALKDPALQKLQAILHLIQE
jgi:hypothetical protein